MSACESAKADLRNAKEARSREESVLAEYRAKLSRLEDEHSTLEWKWKDASALVVTHENELADARVVRRDKVFAEKEAEEQLAYWREQWRRFQNGETTDYDGEPNEEALLRGKKERASSAEWDAEQERKRAEDEVRAADARYQQSRRHLQTAADRMHDNEDAQSTTRNRISLQKDSVEAANDWVSRAKTEVERECGSNV